MKKNKHIEYIVIIIGVAFGTVVAFLVFLGGESYCLQKLQEYENPKQKTESMTEEIWLKNK